MDKNIEGTEFEKSNTTNTCTTISTIDHNIDIIILKLLNLKKTVIHRMKVGNVIKFIIQNLRVEMNPN